MSTIFFCIPYVEALVDIIETAAKQFPEDLEVKFIRDLDPTSFSEVTSGDLVVIYYHGTLADPEAIELKREYQLIVQILEGRNAEVGIFYPATTDNSRSEWPRPEKVTFELSIQRGFINNLVRTICSVVENDTNKLSESFA